MILFMLAQSEKLFIAQSNPSMSSSTEAGNENQLNFLAFDSFFPSALSVVVVVVFVVFETVYDLQIVIKLSQRSVYYHHDFTIKISIKA
jgi:hypothetical protein